MIAFAHTNLKLLANRLRVLVLLSAIFELCNLSSKLLSLAKPLKKSNYVHSMTFFGLRLQSDKPLLHNIPPNVRFKDCHEYYVNGEAHS